MTASEFYSELKAWQDGIGSILGFVALIAAALFNFHLTRRLERESRGREARAVAAALYGELLLLEDQLAQAASAVAAMFLDDSTPEIGPDFLQQHHLPEPELYPALASKLGLLNAEIVLAITAFHADYQGAKAVLPLVSFDRGPRHPHGVVLFLRPAVEAVERLQAGLELLGEMIGVGAPRRTPDLRAAQDVLEREM
jgi:hypothetical protein